MEVFLKGASLALMAAVLGLILAKQGKDFSILLTLLACCMLAGAAIRYLTPVMDFFYQLQELGNLDGSIMGVLIKAVGIAMVGELASLVCSDAGNASLGKALQMVTAAAVLWLSLPLFQSLLELIQGILGEI